MLSNYEVSRMVHLCFALLAKIFPSLIVISNYDPKVFKLLSDLKEQRKESGKTKHAAGHQNLNTIMYEVGSHPLRNSVMCNGHV